MKKQAQQQQEWRVLVRYSWHYAAPPTNTLFYVASPLGEAWAVKTKHSFFHLLSLFFFCSLTTVKSFQNQVYWIYNKYSHRMQVWTLNKVAWVMSVFQTFSRS
jgi:hypothetical protein